MVTKCQMEDSIRVMLLHTIDFITSAQLMEEEGSHCGLTNAARKELAGQHVSKTFSLSKKLPYYKAPSSCKTNFLKMQHKNGTPYLPLHETVVNGKLKTFISKSQ